MRRLFGIALGLALPAVAAQGVVHEAIGTARAATAKVIVHRGGRGDIVASGFLYKEKDLAVTCLHVVAEAQGIEVLFESATRTATVAKVLRRADLALLQLNEAVAAEPLVARPDPALDGAELTALGYPLASPAMKSIDCRRRQVGGHRLRDLIGNAALRQEITRLGFPSLSAEVLDLQASLVPGMSGCPVIDDEGLVAGIGNGGLESGFSELTWAIERDALAALLESEDAVVTAQERRKAETLFGAELRASTGAKVELGGAVFTKLRTRRIRELIAYTDDRLGLQQLMQQFQPAQPDRWEFDVYRELDSGAMFFVPAGAEVETDGEDVTVASEAMRLRARFQEQHGPEESQAASVQFERDLVNGEVWSWMENQMWSYPQPIYYPSGLMVRRRSWISRMPVMGPNGMPLPQSYLFETFASSRERILSVGAVNEMYPQIFADPEQLKVWGQYVLAVQMATFSDRERRQAR